MLTTLPALCLLSLISLAYFLCEKNGVEQIVWPRPPREPKISGTNSVSNLILAVEVRCNKVQGMTEAFFDGINLSAVSLEKSRLYGELRFCTAILGG